MKAPGVVLLASLGFRPNEAAVYSNGLPPGFVGIVPNAPARPPSLAEQMLSGCTAPWWNEAREVVRSLTPTLARPSAPKLEHVFFGDDDRQALQAQRPSTMEID